MINPTMLYKSGGDFSFEGHNFETIIVAEEDVAAELKKGWHRHPDEAKKASVKSAPKKPEVKAKESLDVLD